MRDDFPVVLRSRGKCLPPQRVHEIACSRCPATSTLSLVGSAGLPAHTVALKFGQRGWRVVGVGKHLCPACDAASRKPSAARAAIPAEDPTMPPKAAPKPAPASPAPAANENAVAHASPAASDAIVNLYLILSDRYDKARKAYVAGWDDARVARETGLALPVVQERREHDFGPLVVGPTLGDIRAELHALHGEIGEARAVLKAGVDVLLRMFERHQKLTEMLAAVEGKPGIAPHEAA